MKQADYLYLLNVFFDLTKNEEGIEMLNDPYVTESSLINVLEKGKADDFPSTNGKNTHLKRYEELDAYFSEFPVETGAMKSEIGKWKEELGVQLEKIAKIENEAERIRKVQELLSEDKVIFLNKHGKDHTNKVCEKAFEIIKCFTHNKPSYYEVYFLLCAISVHDVGNFYGRENHEKRIYNMLNSDCSNILVDAVERRIISRIAGAHGGYINNNKDTISFLKRTDMINNMEVREQLLAAVLRFADELADDSSRAIDPALKSGILGKASEIFHVYSSKLHTVILRQNPVTAAWNVVLRYEFDEDTAKEQFSKGNTKKYLLDEIYDRTIKMDQERRYCMRFFGTYCSIESIDVEITIVNKGNAFKTKTISYILQEKGYPDHPYSTIKDVDDRIPTGDEMVIELSKEG